MIDMSIRGIQKVQQANLQMIRAMKPSGALGRAIQYAGLAMHRHVVPSTPHEYGALRAAHQVENKPLQARIYIDPGARAPRRNARPAVYGARLHGHGMIPGLRSGIRAFYAYSVQTYGAKVAKGAIREFKRELP